MQKHIILGTSLTLLAALITGCEINEDVNPNPASTTQVTITPSLGKILNAKVVLRNAKTGDQIGEEGNTGTSGTATFNVPKTADPVVIEVQGTAGATYFDESKKNSAPFDADQVIKAVVPTLTSNANIGVSALTDIAYKAAFKKAGDNEKSITATIATASNDAIRTALAPELSSITIAPTIIGSVDDWTNLANTDAGKYALKLAALAQLVSSEDTTPALTALNKLAEDIADGEFDGMANETAIGLYTKANLESKFRENLTSIINTVNLTGFDANTFTFGFGSVVINVGSGGTGVQTGNTCLLDVSGSVTQPVIGTVAFAYKYCYINMPVDACSSTNSQLSSLVSGAVSQQGAGVTFNVNSFTPSNNCDGAFVSYDYATNQVVLNP